MVECLCYACWRLLLWFLMCGTLYSQFTFFVKMLSDTMQYVQVHVVTYLKPY